MRLLLLLLMLVPTGAWSAPCCEEVQADTCCPVERDCTAEEDTCPAAAHVVAVAPVSFVAASPAVAPVVLVAAPAAILEAPPPPDLRATRLTPLRN